MQLSNIADTGRYVSSSFESWPNRLGRGWGGALPTVGAVAKLTGDSDRHRQLRRFNMQAIGIDHLFGKGQFATDTDGIMPAGMAASQTGPGCGSGDGEVTASIRHEGYLGTNDARCQEGVMNDPPGTGAAVPGNAHT